MKMFIIILITFATIRHFVGDSFASEDYDIRNLLRKKRWLLFPNPLQSETKLQVLFGLGLPMESEVSMTLGYVLKCNYRLPYKAADINDDPYVRHARATKRDNVSESLLPSSRKIATLSRWGLYRILEIAMETQGSDGRACLLRAICESAETPFWSGYNDLLGEILRVVLTPSTTHGEYEMYSNREYHAAEVIGKDSDGETCKMAYPECTYSPLDYFTRKSYF